MRLRRQIPFTAAMDMLLTARAVSADEALRIGLIGRVVPDGKALEEALEIAEVICGNGPLAVEAIKRSVRETEGMSEEEGLARELEIGWPVFASQTRRRDSVLSRRSASRTSSGPRSMTVSDFGISGPLAGDDGIPRDDDPRYKLSGLDEAHQLARRRSADRRRSARFGDSKARGDWSPNSRRGRPRTPSQGAPGSEGPCAGFLSDEPGHRVR